MGSEPGIPDAARDLRAAIEHLEQAVRLSPANARYSGLLGEAWLLQGDPEAGLAPLQNSLQQETHPRIASLMAMALLRLDRPADAARIATVALEETSAFPRGHFLRAEARIGLGDVDGAIEDLRHAVSLAPTSEPYRLRLATHLVERARGGDH
ncbi:MAG: tetratricopeptide repeat protein, partial [Planctomycetes bacterium]|nr:tetratricopeptide repeat protein [Planctomycetota bacterium]